MRHCMEDFQYLLDAQTQTCIWVETTETQRFLEDMIELFVTDPRYESKKIYVWDIDNKLTIFSPGSEELFVPVGVFDEELAIITAKDVGLLNYIKMQQMKDGNSNQLFILKNFQVSSKDPNIWQLIANIREKRYNSYIPIIMLSNVVSIAPENEKLFTVFTYELPDEQEIRKIVTDFQTQLNVNAQFDDVSDETVDQAVIAAKGLTSAEIINCLRKSVRKYHTINVDMLRQEKIQIVKRSGCLDFRETSTTSFEDMGGNENFKEWIYEVKNSNTPEAQAFGIEPAKGYIAFGVPGAGKSASAEMCAALFDVPLIELNFSKIMGSLVGQSEKAIDKALSVVKAVAPCVLLIDEAEKSLGGYRSSQSSDSGTLARVLGRILSFMQDNQSVFVVMTSNDITKLPPELLRSGRLDTHWYFGIPTSEERANILDIYLKKKDKFHLSDTVRKHMIKATESYTGAEIRTAVNNMIKKAWVRSSAADVTKSIEVTDDDVVKAVKDIVPIYKSSEDIIFGLKTYAQNHALFASKQVKASPKTASLIDAWR